MDKRSEFLRNFFILRTNLTQVFTKFLGGVEDIIVPFKILRDEGKRLLSMCGDVDSGTNPEKANKIFEKYKSELLEKYKVK